MPVVALGAPRAVVVRWDDAPRLDAPLGARIWLDDSLASTAPVLLTPGVSVRASFGGFALRARLVPFAGARREARGGRRFDPSLEGGRERSWASSAAAHVLLFALLVRATPAPDRIARDALETRQRLLAASAEREVESRPTPSPRALLEEALRRHAPADARVAAEAPRTSSRDAPVVQAVEPRSPSPARGAAVTDAAEGGMVGLVRALKVDPVDAKPWRDALASLGVDDARKQVLFGAESAASWSAGGAHS